VRQALAKSYDISTIEPDIQVVDVDLLGDRELCLRHQVRDGVPLAETERNRVLGYLRQLWGYDVTLEGVEAGTDQTVYEAGTRGLAEAAA